MITSGGPDRAQRRPVTRSYRRPLAAMAWSTVS
jgi:hypothetical protein